MKKILQIDSIDSYNKFFGVETSNPLISVFTPSKNAKISKNNVRINIGLYSIFLKQGASCTLKYGRQYYDYQDGTIVTLAPGQLIEIIHDPEEDKVLQQAYGLIFHPDLIYGTSLGRKIGGYSFFSYSENEALHLSESERAEIIECLKKIQSDIELPVNKTNREKIASHIEKILDGCMHFYDRQFNTRKKANRDVLQKFEMHLNDYFENGIAQKSGVPTVKYFAEKVFRSSGYFGDLIKRETGKNAQEYIQYKLIDVAKHNLLESEKNISVIAYELGFRHPQHFTRLFKRIVGCTPKDFKSQN